MLFRIILCLIYFVTLEISVANSFEHNEDSNICSQDQESEKNLNCDYHCISEGLIDDTWLNPGKNNFEVHNVCRDMGFTHIEGLINLDQLIGKGRFKFIGLPLKIRGGTGSPIRAVAVFDT